MRLVGMRPVVVHGGGPQISELMTKLGKQSEFRNGLRVTDAETVDIARMVLIGQVNPQIVSAINVHGNYAVGVSGEDGGLIKASVRDPELGFVGNVESINPAVLLRLLEDEFIPVIATVGTDASGQAYNINADTVAGAIAEALGAEKLVYLTDIEGLASPRRRSRQPDPPGHRRRDRRPDRRRNDRRRDDPEGRELHARRAQRCPQRPHPRRSDRPRAAARDLHRPGDRHDALTRGCDMSAHTFDIAGLDHCPFMPVFGAPAISIERGQGNRAVGHRRQALSRLPVRDRRGRRWVTPIR